MTTIQINPVHLPSHHPPQWHSDYMLVQQYLSGSQSAWDILYRQAYPGALRFLSKQPCMHYLSFADMADILSESFLRCQMRADQFEGRSSFLTWGCGFVKYVALSAASKRISHDKKVSDLGISVSSKEFQLQSGNGFASAGTGSLPLGCIQYASAISPGPDWIPGIEAAFILGSPVCYPSFAEITNGMRIAPFPRNI